MNKEIEQNSSTSCMSLSDTQILMKMEGLVEEAVLKNRYAFEAVESLINPCTPEGSGIRDILVHMVRGKIRDIKEHADSIKDEVPSIRLTPPPAELEEHYRQIDIIHRNITYATYVHESVFRSVAITVGTAKGRNNELTRRIYNHVWMWIPRGNTEGAVMVKGVWEED